MTDRPKDQWIEEEKTIPIKTVDEHGNEQIHEKVVKERVRYASIIPHAICAADTHRFALVGRNQDGRVTATCGVCGLGRHFIVGQHRIENGHILTRGRDF